MNTRQKWFKKRKDILILAGLLAFILAIVFGSATLADYQQYARGISINRAL